MQNKKVVMVAGSMVFVVAIIAIFIGTLGNRGMRAKSFGYGKGRMMGRSAVTYPTRPVEDKDQFIVPQDAAKSGELAIIVDDLEGARKKVAEIAAQNDGTVYATFISYKSNELRNGSMVVQVPDTNFDKAFENLKTAGQQIVQESTEQIEKRIVYPMPAFGRAEDLAPGEDAEKTTAGDAQAGGDIAVPALKEEPGASQSSPEAQGAAQPQIAIYPQPLNQTQDKGYIRLVFAEYGAGKSIGAIKNQAPIGMMLFSSEGQNAPKAIWIGLGIKLLLLIVLISLLVFILRKIFHNLRRHRTSVKEKNRTRMAEKKSVVHVVRQAPRARIVNTKRKQLQ